MKNSNSFRYWAALLCASILAISACKPRDGHAGAVIDNLGGIKANASGLDLNGKPAFNAPAPTTTSALANKAYVDTAVSGVSGSTSIVVDAATTIALPAYTAAGAGVGKTITLNSSAPCPTIDGLTPSTTSAIGSYASVLLQNGAVFPDNGPYVVTTSTGSSCVLTRDPRADTMAEIIASSIRIKQGNARRNAVYQYINDPGITLDTGMAAWARTDGERGPNEYSRIVDDFDEAMTATGTVGNGVNMPGPLGCLSTISGTASIALGTVAGTASERGIVRLSATTTTGAASCTWSLGVRPLVISTPSYFRMRLRLAGPTVLSDGTDTFRVLVGLGTGTGTSSTDGVLAEYTQATDTHWLFTTRASSVSTSTPSATTVTVGTYTRADFWKYAGETTIHGSFDGVEAGTGNISNLPGATPLTFVMSITKSLGNTAARSFDIDFVDIEQAYPNGRSQ
jgi:hypothetical protein